jgi:hypothetical protein
MRLCGRLVTNGLIQLFDLDDQKNSDSLCGRQLDGQIDRKLLSLNSLSWKCIVTQSVQQGCQARS